jgi:hypothetical protein
MRPVGRSEERRQAGAEALAWPTVWRSFLASQVEVLVSVGSPKKIGREIPESRRFEMP